MLVSSSISHISRCKPKIIVIINKHDYKINADNENNNNDSNNNNIIIILYQQVEK